MTRALSRVTNCARRWGALCVGKFLCLIGRWVLALRYRVVVQGAETVRQRGTKGILFLPNHPALIDPVILIAHLYGIFGIRPVAVEDQLQAPLVGALAKLLGVLHIPTLSTVEEDSVKAVQESIERCIQALRHGDNVLLYPAGRLMRQGCERLGGVSGAHRIISELPDVRVVLIRTTGLWGSSFGWASGRAPRLQRGFLGHLGSMLLSGVFFMPRRAVHVQLAEPDDLPRQGERVALTAYLDQFYNKVAQPPLYVPYDIWEKGGTRELPEAPRSQAKASGDAPAATRHMVIARLQAITGIDGLRDDQELVRDLGLDSLAIVNAILWLETEFGVSVPSPEAVRTVGELVMAACGSASSEPVPVRVGRPPAGWWANTGNARVQIPGGSSIQEVFLAQARRHPGQVIVADLVQGSRTYRELIAAILALVPKIAALPGQFVGIMLPASVAADAAFMATLFAGKTPVMVNWTSGPRVVKLGLNGVGAPKILTAQALLRRLSAQGFPLAELGDRLVPLEILAGTISGTEKLSALIRSFCSWRSLAQVVPKDTAVVLFTSGSEALPKAVPLSHQNILTNIRDSLSIFSVFESDRLLGILPPFHSFGLTGTSLLPLLAGLKVVHHADPNEVATIVSVIERFKPSILLSTPTFVHNIARAGSESALGSLRLCITGADKCSRETYDAVKTICPKCAILEGYGITECSPIVSVMREDDITPGTIGKLLPSVRAMVIGLDTHRPVAPGDTGMLLLRGPSIFSGYLNYDGASPFERLENESWYRTGDLVAIDDQQRLVFKGRLKRFVKIGGEMISLGAIEEVLLKSFGKPGDKGPCLAVLPTADERHPELVLFTMRALDRGQVNEVIRLAGLSGLHHIRIVQEVPRIPLLGTGKPDYRTLAQGLTPGGNPQLPKGAGPAEELHGMVDIASS